MNIEQIRSLFPVTKEAVFLNSASQSPLNTLVNDKLQDHLKTESNLVGKKPFNRNDTRTLLSKLLGGLPKEYALVTSTGIGVSIVAQGLDFKAGDNVVVPALEHWNNTFPWLALRNRGVEVRFAKLNDDNSINPDTINQLIDHRTRIVSIAAVRFNSGFRPNLSTIGEMAHKKGALFMVDAAQGAGHTPINVERDGIDIMAGCGFKWLLGMHGTGYLYVNEKVNEMITPILPGMFAADHHFDRLNYHNDARKFETGTIAYSLFDAWSAGLSLLHDIGITNIYDVALQNTDLILEGLQEKNYKIITPLKNREQRSAIVHFTAQSKDATTQLYHKLISEKVLVTLQGENIRVSPNFFNTKDDIDAFLSLI